MGFLDRLLGRPERTEGTDRWGASQQPQQPAQDGYRYGQQSYQAPPQQQGHQYGQQSYQSPPQQAGWGQTPAVGAQQRTEDEQAVERYRYLLRTAPPERIEQVHAEAFERLSPEQRRMVYDEFTRTAPEGEAPRGDDPRSLAQAATRSEIRQPGFMERSLGGMNGRGPGGGVFGGGGRSGPGFGSMLGASILGTVAGYVIGSTLMSAFLPDPGGMDGGTDASGGDGGDGNGGDGGGGDSSGDGGGDFGGDAQAADWGGGFDGGGFDQGFGDFGGDFDV